MSVRTVQDLGLAVREARRHQNLTQQELADRLGVSRAWVVRLEAGHPRLETQLVLDAVAAVGLELVAREAPVVADADADPFGAVFDELGGP